MKDFMIFGNNDQKFFLEIFGNKRDWLPEARGFTMLAFWISLDALILGLCHYIQLFHFYTACRIRCKQITISYIYFQLIYLSACLLLL